MIDHVSTLEFNSDDGIFIQCTCGWDQPLGWSPSAPRAYHLWKAHEQSALGEDEDDYPHNLIGGY